MSGRDAVLWFILVLCVCFMGFRRKKPTPPADPMPNPEPVKRRRRTSAEKRHDDEVARREARKAHWAHRMPQLLSATDDRPYWQFRTVDDGRDPPDCQAVNGYIARYDSPFWQKHNPAKCRRDACRCSIRSYDDRDIEVRGLHVSE